MRLDPNVETYPVAGSTTITAGDIVGINSAGVAAAVSSTYNIVVGRAVFTVTNSGGAGDKLVTVARGVLAMQNSATDPVSEANVGQVVYAESPTIVSTDTALPRLGVLAAMAPGPWVAVGFNTDPFGGRPFVRSLTVSASQGLTLEPNDTFVAVTVTGLQEGFTITAPPAPAQAERALVGCISLSAGSTARLVTLNGFTVLGTGASWSVPANTKRLFAYSWDGSAWMWHGNFTEEEIPELPQSKISGLQAALSDREQIHQYYSDFSAGGTNTPISFGDRRGAILKLTQGVSTFALPTNGPTTTERRSEHWVRCIAFGGQRTIAPGAWSAYQYGGTIEPSVGWAIDEGSFVDFKLTRIHDGTNETWFVDLLQPAGRTGVNLIPTNYTASFNTVESHLLGINTRLRRGTAWAATRQTPLSTSDTSALSLFAATIPANTVQAGDAIEIIACGTITYQSQQTLTFAIVQGSSTIWQASVYMPSAQNGAWVLRVTGKVGAPGTSCIVRWGGNCTLNCEATSTIGLSGFGPSPRVASIAVNGTVDTTGDWNIAGTLIPGGGTNTITSEFFDLRIERSDYA